MSVRVSERSESKLEVQVRAEELVSYTVHIVSNPKVFDPKYTRFHDRIVDCAVSAGQCLWEANGIRVGKDPERYRIRRGLQDEAIRSINNMFYLMAVARRLDHLRSRKYAHWVEMTPFLGFDFRIARSGDVVTTVRPESVKRMRRRVSRLMALEARGLRPPGTAAESFRGSMEHYSKGDSRLLLERCEGWFGELSRRYA